MQQIAVVGQAPLLRGFAAKIVVDVVPAALASLIVGYLLTQYQFGHATSPVAATRSGPASVELMQLLRDEHAAMMDYIKAQTAAEQSRNAAEDNADAKAAADARAAAAATTARRLAAAAVATAPAASHSKVRASVTAAIPLPPQAPLAIAQATQNDGTAPAPIATAPASGSLFARTMDIKDHVVHATLHMVSAIGGIPNWIASIGDRMGGGDADPGEARLSATSS
jgi:hypothetical protein